MQVVIKNGKVLATHTDEQSLVGLYPGCTIVSWPGVVELGAVDPRTAAQKALEYKDKRRLEYPSIQDQLDMMYADRVNGTNTWVEAIKAIKDKYPVVLKS